MTKETKKTTTASYQPALQQLYKEKVLPALLKDLGIKSPMAAPKLEKIVINIGVKEAREDIKALEIAKEDLTAIAMSFEEECKKLVNPQYDIVERE